MIILIGIPLWVALVALTWSSKTRRDRPATWKQWRVILIAAFGAFLLYMSQQP